MSTRAKYGLGVSDRLALCPARLEPVKGLLGFLYSMPIDALKGWKLLIVGEGTEKAALEGAIEQRGLKDTVHIENYVDYKKMPSLYAAADLFVLPSIYDPNPLSVIEALHSGLPLLLSKQVGNYPEALLEGETGWGFSPFDVVELRSAMRQAFSASTGQLREYGRNAKLQAEKVWDSKHAICKFLDSLNIPRYSESPMSEALG